MTNIVAHDDTNFYSVQHANSLFHFMKKIEYLMDIISNKRISPRYCKEDISYLDLPSNNTTIDSVYILEKCFCDLKLSNLNNKFEVLEEHKGRLNRIKRSHLELYGYFGIAFDKNWALEKWSIQQVKYLNTKDQTQYIELIKQLYLKEDTDDTISYFLLRDICFTKPLEGEMEREEDNGEKVKVKKNFSDECEWRYVPFSPKWNTKSICAYTPETANLNEKLKSLDIPFLKFEYNDIKYIIVPDEQAKNKIIDMILKLSISREEKMNLAHKIEVFKDLKGDL